MSCSEHLPTGLSYHCAIVDAKSENDRQKGKITNFIYCQNKSRQVKWSWYRNQTNSCMMNVESAIWEIFPCGIRDTGPWNLESNWRNLEYRNSSSILSNNWNVKSTAWNPESKTTLNYITWHEINHKVSELHKEIISHWKHYGAGTDSFYK